MSAWPLPGPRTKGKCPEVPRCASAQEATKNFDHHFPKSVQTHSHSSKLLILPAKDRASPLRSGSSIRNAIRRLREDSRTTRRRRRTISIPRRVRERKPPLTEWVPVDLAEVVADVAIALIRVLKLQDISRPFRHRDFQRMAPIRCLAVCFGIGASVGIEGLRGTAACWVLNTDVYIGGEAAFVDN